MSRKITHRMKIESRKVSNLIVKEKNPEKLCPLLDSCEDMKILKGDEEKIVMYDLVCRDFINCKRYFNRNDKNYLKDESKRLEQIN